MAVLLSMVIALVMSSAEALALPRNPWQASTMRSGAPSSVAGGIVGPKGPASKAMDFTCAVEIKDCTPELFLPAGQDPYQRLDYHWIPQPRNVTESKQVGLAMRIPVLLWQACSAPDRSGKGEDYMYHVVAEASLLQLIESATGRAQLNKAFIAEPPLHDPGGTYQQCITNLADNWRPWATQPLSTAKGWQQVIDDVNHVPALQGKPGTSSVTGCRTSGDLDEWEVTMALVMRVWGLMSSETPENLFGLANDPNNQSEISEKKRILTDQVAARAWLQGSAADIDTTVCNIAGTDIPETENHTWVIRTTRFLHNELLPIVSQPFDSYVAKYNVDGNADNSTNGLSTYVIQKMRDVLQHDWIEYNARPYVRWQMLGLLNLFDFGDPRIKQLAGEALDFMSVKHAAESMDNKRITPFRRRAEDESDKLYQGRTTDPMFEVWVGGLPEPVFPVATGGDNVAGEMTLAASSDYQPPPFVTDTMLNPAHRQYLEYFNGQGQHEAAYGGPNFVITGGGIRTGCPYPGPFFDPCIGSGNDDGTVEPIVLIPHQVRTDLDDLSPRTTDYPSYNDEIRIPPVSSGNNCIYRNFACGRGSVSIPPALLNSSCTISGNNPAAGQAPQYTDVAVRIDAHCTNDSRYAADCLFVYTAAVGQIGYFVTHPCSPTANEADTDRAFHAFIKYMQTIGRPSLDSVLPFYAKLQLTLPPEVVDLTGITTGEAVNAVQTDSVFASARWVINGQVPEAVMQGSLALTGGQYPTTSTALSSTPGNTSYFQQSVPLVATITASGGQTGMTGTVTFLEGGQVLGTAPVTATATGGEARLTVDSLSVGTHQLTASYDGDATFVASTADIVHTVLQAPTKLSYTGDRTGDYNDPATVAATLTNAVTNAPVSGAPIDLTFDGQKLCSQPTDTAGQASCRVSPNEPAGMYPVTATFAGDTNYQPSRAEEQFTVTKEETTLSYTGPTVLAANGATLKTALKEDGVTPINGRAVTITLSDSTASQSCTGTTDTSGNASCTISPITVALGNDTITASFAGDQFYRPSNDSVKAMVFAFPASGAFVVGDNSPRPQVDFWGNQWAKTNGLSTGPAPDAFKGFAATTSEPPACSAPWSTDPGHSSRPPSSVPSYMGVPVASQVSQNGSTISGNTVHIVVVKTDPGYTTDPGHRGTGTVVATFC